MDGEVIVSFDTAAKVAPEFGWSTQEELLLYVIHGCLHLVGYDDHNDEDRAAMRVGEAKYLAKAGIECPESRLGHTATPQPASARAEEDAPE